MAEQGRLKTTAGRSTFSILLAQDLAVAPILVATGEHCANRVMFKQFMQAGAIGVCQIDSCRIGGELQQCERGKL